MTDKTMQEKGEADRRFMEKARLYDEEQNYADLPRRSACRHATQLPKRSLRER